jgi:hypothetical protein
VSALTAVGGKGHPPVVRSPVVALNCPVPTDYRFAPALLVRSMGGLLAVVGVVLVLVALLVGSTGLPGAVLTTAVVLGAVLVFTVAVVMWRGAPLVRFDEAGYQVRFLRGAGTRQGRWREVEDAVTATVAGHDCVVLRLKDGRTTTIPVRVLDTDPASFMADLGSRLDKGHGYRRLS